MSEKKLIPYGRHLIEADDLAAVTEVLSGDWLTTGPAVPRFEAAFAQYVGARHAIACSNGTAALHLAMLAIGIGPGDEVIVPAMTFAASANCVRYAGGTVVFCDVLQDTLNIDPAHAASLITSRTKAIVAVDYAGLPADLEPLMTLCRQHDLVLVEDACHAPGAEYLGARVGSIAHLSTFSFHPVKHMTTGEGGMVTSNDQALADHVRRLRNHGITSDHRQREIQGTFRYDMVELGFNYRLPDLQCALGQAQLKKLPMWLERRRAAAARYQRELSSVSSLRLPTEPADRKHAYHLYPVRVVADDVAAARQTMYAALRADGIGVNVHYLPVYLHSYYRELGYRPGLCPVAEAAFDGLLSIPMWHGMSEAQQSEVIAACKRHAPVARTVGVS
jgi:perosamine synthetase